MRRWSTIWFVTILVTTMLAAPAAAQYADVLLPQGVLQVTVDDQPINATTAPVSTVVNPMVAGSLGTGNITIELAIADEDGNVIRFPAEVNRRGTFRARPPEALQPGGTYTLYINDAMIGEFSVSPDATGDDTTTTTSSTLDLARLSPFPQDAGDALAGLGLVPELSRYQSIAELSRIVAQNANNNTREGRQEAQANLEASGFVQRYQSSLAVPSADDPSVFEIQIAAIVTEYDSPESAAAAYAASATGGEDVEAATFGEESRVSSQSATATQTGAEYQSLQLIFRQDRVLVVINYADLLNRAPDQAVLEAMGQAVQQRATAALAGEVPGLTQAALRMGTGGVPRTADMQYYEAIDGALVPLFGESEEGLAARLANSSGATNVAIARMVSQGTDTAATPTADAVTVPPFAYTSTLYAFPTAEDASAWLGGLTDRLAADPLPGYLSFSAVTDAPTFGDDSATYSFSRQLEGQNASGFRVYVQIGAGIAAVELAAVPEAPFAAVEPLVALQVECLTADACAGSASAPEQFVGAAADDGGGDGEGGGNGGDNQGDGGGQGNQGGNGQGQDAAGDDGGQGDLPAGMQRETATPDE